MCSSPPFLQQGEDDLFNRNLLIVIPIRRKCLRSSKRCPPCSACRWITNLMEPGECRPSPLPVRVSIRTPAAASVPENNHVQVAAMHQLSGPTVLRLVRAHDWQLI